MNKLEDIKKTIHINFENIKNEMEKLEKIYKIIKETNKDIKQKEIINNCELLENLLNKIQSSHNFYIKENKIFLQNIKKLKYSNCIHDFEIYSNLYERSYTCKICNYSK